MPIKWKRTPRFKPSVIINKIASVRIFNAGSGASFSGFVLEEYLPVLQSMLDFPPVARDADVATLVWRGLANVGKDLSPDTFLASINQELRKGISTRDCFYYVLSAVSLDIRDVPEKSRVMGAEIRLFRNDYSRRFGSRANLLNVRRRGVSPTPSNYCKIAIRVKAKSPAAALGKALRAIDLQRAIWCLMCNPQMQISLGGSPFVPINVMRLGSVHTVHHADGAMATETVWFEPNFVDARIFRIGKPDVVRKNSRWALRRISSCRYQDSLASSLIRFVRALDEKDPNVAFVRLWGALEALVSPGLADYDKVVRRCSFLFKDREFHSQVLEHLREYRNENLHAGEESERARTHCFQLQLYYSHLVWFHLRNVNVFRSLDDVNEFLDLPSDLSELKRRSNLLKKAIKYIG